MKLLVVTQVLDKNDAVLGFFHEWVRALAGHYEGITVICLKEGMHDLPKNVQVYSLGKEKGRLPRTEYASRFLSLAWKLRNEYNTVFIHMNQEYILIAGWLWRLLGKPLYMWRNHYAGTWLTDIAAGFCAKVFCTSEFSYTAKYKNTVLMPVGVDLTRFTLEKNIPRKPHSILFLSRMSPSKHLEVLIDALKIVQEKAIPFTASFYGDALPADQIYYQSLKESVYAAGLSEAVSFYPGISNAETPEVYGAHELFVNCSPSGMFDKTIFEAAASGCIVLASSKDLENAVGEGSYFATAAELAEKLLKVLASNTTVEGTLLRTAMQTVVQKNSLDSLIQKIVKEIAQPNVLKFAYCSSISYPSPYANRLQTLQTSEALHEILSSKNSTFYLLATNVHDQESLYKGALKNFYSMKSIVLAWKQLQYIRQENISSLFCREHPLLFLLLIYNRFFFQMNFIVAYEAHEEFSDFRFKYVLRHADQVFCITQNLQNVLQSSAPKTLMSVLPDAVDLSLFAGLIAPDEIRSKYGIPAHVPVAMYVGSVDVHSWKGVDVFLDSQVYLSNKEIVYVVVGIRPDTKAQWKEKYPKEKIIFLERIPIAEAATLMRSATVLVLPNKGDSLISAQYTSPLKLFEYMAAKVPIVASDLPSIREVLDESNALLVEAGSPKALAEGIDIIVQNPHDSERRAHAAYQKIQEYTWQNRAKTIIQSMRAK